MSIPIACECGYVGKAPDSVAGKKVRCKKCGAPIAVLSAKPPELEPGPPITRTADRRGESLSPRRHSTHSKIPMIARVAIILLVALVTFLGTLLAVKSMS